MADTINPKHYKSHPSGVECIEITEHMNFNKGNAVKYIWRSGDKGNEIEDLKKAKWYIEREIERLEKTKRGFYDRPRELKQARGEYRFTAEELADTDADTRPKLF